MLQKLSAYTDKISLHNKSLARVLDLWFANNVLCDKEVLQASVSSKHFEITSRKETSNSTAIVRSKKESQKDRSGHSNSDSLERKDCCCMKTAEKRSRKLKYALLRSNCNGDS